MNKIAYLDCPTGIAGDMCLGALVDAGVPLSYLVEQLGRLGIAREYHLWAERVQRNGQQATKVHVDLRVDEALPPAEASAIADSTVAKSKVVEGTVASHKTEHHHHHSATEPVAAAETAVTSAHTHHHSSHSHSHSHSHSDYSHSGHSHTHTSDRQEEDNHHHGWRRHLPEIEQLIVAANLPARAAAWSLAVFRQLAVAEGAIHGIPPEQVHFHEVGATDAIVDIVGTCLGLDWLGIDRLYCSPLPTGGGTIRAAHGRLPVPAPAVLKLFELRQVPIYSNGIEREMVTPTGAAIATTLAVEFGPPPTMTLTRIGLGAGTISLPLPNILRLWIGEDADRQSPSAATTRATGQQESREAHTPPPAAIHPIAVLETQLDDLTPQAIGYTYEALFAVGALDVFTQAIAMKKSRPGVLLTVICAPEQIEACEAVLFRETTTLGIRRSLQERHALHRELQSIQTEYGTVQIKVAWLDDPAHPTNVQPEYEDCARIARQYGLPWLEVHRLALQCWYSHHHP